MDMEGRGQYHSSGTIYSLFKERFTIFDRVYLCVDVYLWIQVLRNLGEGEMDILDLEL